MKRAKKIILISSLIIILLVAALEALSRFYLPKIIGPRIAREISETTGCRTEFDQVRLSLFGGLIISDLTIYDSQDFGGKPFLSASRLRVLPRIFPLLLMRFEVRVAEIDSPAITMAQNDAGRWNIAELASYIAKRRGEGISPPAEVKLQDGRLAVAYTPLSEAKTAAEKINMAFRFTPDGKASYRGSARILPSEESELTFSGTYDTVVGKNIIKVAGEHLPVSPYSSLISEISGIPLTDPTGELDFDLDIDMTSGREIRGSGTATWKDIRIEDRSILFNGDLAIEGDFYSDMKKKPLYRGRVKVSSSTLNIKTLPHEFTDVEGLIMISDNMVSTTKLAGNYCGYGVDAMGNLTGFSSPELDLRVRSTVGLKEILEFFDIYDEVAEAETFSGMAETELFIKGNLLEANGLLITGNFTIQDGAIKPRGVPAVKDIAGEIYLISDELIVKNLKGTFGDNTVSIKGNITLADEPQVDLTFSSTDLLISLEGAIGKDGLQLESLGGNIGTSTFSISGSINDFDNPDLDLSYRGKADLTPIVKKIKEVYPEKPFLISFLPEGSLRVEGSIAGRPSSPKELTVDIKGTSNSFEFNRWFVNRVSFSGNMKDKVITLENFGGILNQGEIKARASVDMRQEKVKIEVYGSASGVNFSKKLSGEGEKEIYGTLTGNINVEGLPADPGSLSGKGGFTIDKGKIWQLRFFTGLLDILSVAYPGTGNTVFDRIGGTFSLKNGYIESNDLILDSPSVKLSPKGRMGLDGSLDFNVEVDLFDTKGNIIKKVTGTIMNIPGQFMGVKLTGTLQDPQWRPVMIPFMEGIKRTRKRGTDLLRKALPGKSE